MNKLYNIFIRTLRYSNISVPTYKRKIIRISFELETICIPIIVHIDPIQTSSWRYFKFYRTYSTDISEQFIVQ